MNIPSSEEHEKSKINIILLSIIENVNMVKVQ